MFPVCIELELKLDVFFAPLVDVKMGLERVIKHVGSHTSTEKEGMQESMDCRLLFL